MRKLNLASAVLFGLLGPRVAAPTSGGRLERARTALRRRAKWAPSGAGEKEKARRRLQMARGLLSFGPHGRGR